MNLKQHAKGVFQLLFILFFCMPILRAQKTVDQVLKKSTTQTISLDHQDLSTKSTTFTQVLDLGEYGTYQLSLEQTNLFSDGYLERRANKNDGMKLPTTFKGAIQGQANSLVSLTTSEGFLSGFIDTGDEVIFFEPHKNLNANAAVDELIIYYESDVIDQGHSCAANHTHEQSEHIDTQSNQLKSGMAGCYEVEIVLAADYDMYQKHGNSTLSHMASVLSNVQANYDNEFNDPITFIVVDDYIATSTGLDLWTNTTNASDLLGEFGNSNISNVPYDLASLWVTRDIVGTTASTVGLARTNGTCNFRYNLIEDYSSSSASLRVLLAHEIGHNFGATHDVEGSSTIMAPSVSNTNTWSTQSEEQINAFYPTATCLCAAGYEEMDLAIDSCSNYSVSGNVITISGPDIKNIGPLTSGATKVGWYLSSDNTITTDDYLLVFGNLSALNPGITTSYNEFTRNLSNVPLPDGNYYFGAIIDYENTLVEFSKENNICASSSAHITIGTPPAPEPDLIISSKSISSSTVACGATITASATVKNDGDAIAGSASHMRYYLSTNTTWDNNDIYLSQQDWVPNLAAGSTSGEFAPVTIPANTAPGTYYILFRADVNNLVSESSEGNNVAAQQITVTCITEPDLIISAKSVSSSTVACGATITASATVKNDGDAIAGSASHMRYYLSTNTVWDNNDIYLSQQDWVPNLAAGSTSGEFAPVTIPANTAPGTYYILFRADVNNLVSESSEGNNVAAQQITVTCAASEPDLIISSKSVSSSTVACGGTITASAVVKNIGNAAAGSASYFRYYLSTNTTWEGSDTFLAQDVVSNLAANATGSETAPLTIPANTSAGTYYIIFITDSSNLISESNENNNVAFQQITVTCASPQPDLVITSSALNTYSPTCGGTVTATAIIRNDGNSASVTGGFMLYYLSEDMTLDIFEDTYLNYNQLEGLAPNATQTFTKTLTIPDNLTNETYYILFFVDGQNFVLESNEDNNMVYKEITPACSVPGGVDCSTAVNSFPYTEGFENGLGVWTQNTDDDINWTRKSGSTSSNHTGPATADEGSFYMYTEASGNSNKEAILTSSCIDVSDLNNPILDVSYHMYGADMGTFTIEGTLDGTNWLTLFTVTGQQNTSNADAWNVATVSLSPFIGRIVQLRFRGMTGGYYRSDIAFDNINITDGGLNKEFAETGIVDVRNYPNPFSTQTTIEFDLPKDIPVTLFVSDMTGKQIAVILDNEQQYAGKNQVTFDGSNYPSGMYYYTIQAGDYVATKKMILTK